MWLNDEVMILPSVSGAGKGTYRAHVRHKVYTVTLVVNCLFTYLFMHLFTCLFMHLFIFFFLCVPGSQPMVWASGPPRTGPSGTDDHAGRGLRTGTLVMWQSCDSILYVSVISQCVCPDMGAEKRLGHWNTTHSSSRLQHIPFHITLVTTSLASNYPTSYTECHVLLAQCRAVCAWILTLCCYTCLIILLSCQRN